MQEEPRTGRPSRTSGEPPATPYGDVVAALRAVLRRHLDAGTPEHEVRRELQAVTRLARSRGVSAERVIVAARAVVREVSEGRPPGDPAANTERRERLISLCVEAYEAD
jgi:hypothetical protein